ncbi:hydroxyacylglutathione hydrolase [Shewanella sp. AS16]|uniref:hydroxyacylglutathione hydrolase n=1 Tax=Shewanella sp. AS16 TaxID=2907625 RepID=UPI001F38C6D8|nr:hydroxyacylglutathione hydrolase [Shewanella sp. AS16]MCE9684666.1 hydroxyacylglutathione hydrolase [Shewanella sp. AS16]
MLNISGIPAFNDNYIWLIWDQDPTKAYVVDPGDADAVLDYLAAHDLALTGILITHHHADHTGGIAKLQAHYGQALSVYGPEAEQIPGVNQPLPGDQNIRLPFIEPSCCIIRVPGHTSGHIAYLIQDALFCGDTLFSGGCGRLFEGTAAQMLHSLTRLAQFPVNTRVYCAHEYTEANLAFALTVDPLNPQLREYQRWVVKARQHGIPTIPSELSTELAINPFLRCFRKDIQDAIEEKFNRTHLDELQTFTLLRQWKDNF